MAERAAVVCRREDREGATDEYPGLRRIFKPYGLFVQVGKPRSALPRWCANVMSHVQATVRRRTREQGGTWALITFGRSCMQKVLTGMKEGPPGPRTEEMSTLELRKIDPKRAMQSTGEFGNKFHEAMQKAADEFQELKRDRDRMWPYVGAGDLSRDALAEGEPPDATMRCAHFLHRNQ